MNGILLLTALVAVVTAVWTTSGFPAAAAVVCMAGWFRAEALHRGALARLRTAGDELEEAEAARAELQERYDAMPLVALTVHKQGDDSDGEDDRRTIH